MLFFTHTPNTLVWYNTKAASIAACFYKKKKCFAWRVYLNKIQTMESLIESGSPPHIKFCQIVLREIFFTLFDCILLIWIIADTIIANDCTVHKGPEWPWRFSIPLVINLIVNVPAHVRTYLHSKYTGGLLYRVINR